MARQSRNTLGVAERLTQAGRTEAAIRLLYRPARRGHPGACYALGHLLCFAEPEQARPREGWQWLQRAASKGEAHAWLDLARLRVTRRGLVFEDPPGTRTGVRWLRRAARRGAAAAQHSLGSAYTTGDILPENAELARFWYTRAARAGLPEAMYTTGMMWLTGEGGPQDTGEAVRWLAACARGDIANWPHAEFAADVLASIYAGDVEPGFRDPARREHWEGVARRIEALAGEGLA